MAVFLLIYNVKKLMELRYQ